MTHAPTRRSFLAAGALLLAAACASGTDPLDPATGIEVRVLKWPINPVQVEGEDNTAPVAGAVVVIDPLGGDGSRRASTDTAGIVRLPAAPGAYRVSAETCPGAMSLPKQADTVTVAAGSYTSSTLICDTGIR